MGHAVLWSPDGQIVYNLQEALPANSGWELIGGKRINNALQIIGLGYFHGIETGFLLEPQFEADPETSEETLVAQIEPLPLSQDAVGSEPEEIDEQGHVVGVMSYAVRPSPLPFLYGETVQMLPTLTSSYAFVLDINASGTLVGWSDEPSLENGRGALAALWEPNGSGGFTVTDLNTTGAQQARMVYQARFGSQRQRLDRRLRPQVRQREIHVDGPAAHSELNRNGQAQPRQTCIDHSVGPRSRPLD